MSMRKNILVTGANGFVGRKLTAALRSRDYRVCEFSTRDGDISQSPLNFEGIDHVFHLAGRVFVPDSWQHTFAYYQVNVLGTANVLELCRRCSAGLTFVSSYVYGPPQALPVNEEHPLCPNNPYTHSKRLAEELCEFYAHNFGLATTILRPFNLYGPNQKDIFLIPTILNQVLSPTTRIIEVMDLTPRRDYLYLADFVEALLATLERHSFSIYNVGSGYSVSVEDLIKTALDVAGVKKEYRSKTVTRRGEIADVVADITKIKRELGWSPRYSLVEGIKEIMSAVH